MESIVRARGNKTQISSWAGCYATTNTHSSVCTSKVIKTHSCGLNLHQSTRNNSFPCTIERPQMDAHLQVPLYLHFYVRMPIVCTRVTKVGKPPIARKSFIVQLITLMILNVGYKLELSCNMHSRCIDTGHYKYTFLRAKKRQTPRQRKFLLCTKAEAQQSHLIGLSRDIAFSIGV